MHRSPSAVCVIVLALLTLTFALTADAEAILETTTEEPVIRQALLVSSETSLITLAPIAQNNNKNKNKNKDDDENEDGDDNENNGASNTPELKQQYNLVITPVDRGANPAMSLDWPLFDDVSQYAGAGFDVLVFIIDENGELADVDGVFQFQWSQHNYIDPSKPYNRARLEVEGKHFDIEAGRARINNARYDEAGVIRLRGMARIRVPHKQDNDDKGNKGNSNKNEDDDQDDDKSNTRTLVLFDESPLLVMTPFSFIIQRQPSTDEVLAAGETFSLRIIAVNQQGETLENYPDSDSAEGGQGVVTLQTRVANPPDAPFGELRRIDGSPLNELPKSLFTKGEALLSLVYFSDVGDVELSVIDTDYFGFEVAGGYQPLGRFIPDRFELDIELTSLDRSQNIESAYSGEPLSATIEIRALNALTPAELTRNYYAPFAQYNDDALSASLPFEQQAYAEMTYESTISPFEQGISISSLSPLAITLKTLRNPLDVTIDVSFEDEYGAKGTAQSEAIAISHGRIRLSSRNGYAGEYFEVKAAIETYADSLWRLNADENRLQLRDHDLALLRSASSSNGELALSNGLGRFFGGLVYGGEEPLFVIAAALNEPETITIKLAPDSLLSFLAELSEPFSIAPRSGGSTPFISRGRIQHVHSPN